MRATNHLTPGQHSILVDTLTRVFTIPGRDDAVRALNDVSLGADAGTFTAVVGASGSGKSTLLHCTAGLDRPTSGAVQLLGQETSTLTPRRRAEFRAAHVGFIFQEYNLISALTAAENVALPGQLAGTPLSRDTITAALERVGIAHRRNQLPHQLSGGERQRVAVARVMANRPQLVFADEPTGALDPTSASIVLGWLRELADAGSTVMMVTHDVAGAALADDVLVMHAGHLAARLPGGDPEQISRTLSTVRQDVAA